ncbi:MAG: S8 family serine peptidase [Firmicutes bacterium]|nr:S8 family serine peptidase [Bacillota bacterium]
MKKISCLLFALFVLSAVVSLSTDNVVKADVFAFSEKTSEIVYQLNYYVTIDGILTTTDDAEVFMRHTKENTKIGVMFELQYESFVGNLNQTINFNSTAEEVDRAIKLHRQQSKEFYTNKNLAFIQAAGFSQRSRYYQLAVSHFSPHVQVVFENVQAFEKFSRSVASSAKVDSAVYRTSVFMDTPLQNVNLDKTTTNAGEWLPRQCYVDAPFYTMQQVFNDIGINDNDFIGRGLNVAVWDRYILPHPELTRDGLIIDNQGNPPSIIFWEDYHGRNVARTLAGNNGIAPGVSAIFRHAAVGIDSSFDLIDRMNWFLCPSRRISIINASFGGVNTRYIWGNGFIDYIIRNQNIAFVSAAGNTYRGGFTRTSVNFNGIVVGSTNANGYLSRYSAHHINSEFYNYVINMRRPTLSAPGTWLETTLPGMPRTFNTPICRINYGSIGTSFAAPVVSGIIARLMEEFPFLRTSSETIKAALIASATPVNGQAAGVWSIEAGAGRVHYQRAREAVRNAIWFSDLINGGVNNIIESHTINVVPGSSIRVSAVWFANSPTTGVYYSPLQANIHTNYKVRLRGTLSYENHSSNTQLFGHTAVNSQYTIDIVQMANRHINNNQADIGAFTWVYDSAVGDDEGLIVYNNAVIGFNPPLNFDGNVIIPYGIRAIESNAFKNQNLIEHVYISSTVNRIGRYAFFGVRNLRDLVIPLNVTIIEAAAFNPLPSFRIFSKAASLPSGWEAWWHMHSRTYFYNRMLPEVLHSNYWKFVNDVPRTWHEIKTLRLDRLIINFDAQYINAGKIEYIEVYLGQPFGVLPNLTLLRNDLLFGGWWTTPYEGGVQVLGHHIAWQAGEIMLYARWVVRRPVTRPWL